MRYVPSGTPGEVGTSGSRLIKAYNTTSRTARSAPHSRYGISVRCLHASQSWRLKVQTPVAQQRSWKVILIGSLFTASSAAGVLIASVALESPDRGIQRAHNDRSTTPLSKMPTIVHDVSEANIGAAKGEFLDLLGADRVSANPGPCISHSSTEWSAAPRGEIDRYSLVVYPANTLEVSAIAKICYRRRIPMTAFSGGTSLEGTLAAVHGGICLDFKFMNKVLAYHKDDLDVTVQPAVDHLDLNRMIATDDLFFPPDPGPGAQIGGMVGQGCSGTNAYRYGTMKDWVLGLTLVLADGTIVKTRHRPRKSSSGYDLTRLIVGSAGTLAFVTEAHLRLTSKPVNERVAVVAFPSTQAAISVAIKVVQNDIPLSAMEMLCDDSMRAVNLGGYVDRQFEPVPTLFLKFAGKDPGLVDRQIAQVRQIAEEADCSRFEFSRSVEEAESIWMARKTVLWSLLAMKKDPSDIFLSSDAAVPISQLGLIMDEAKEKITKGGFQGSCLGHVGDGNFHAAILFPSGEEHKARDIITWIQRRAIDLGGTVTGEHGVGLEYRDIIGEELGIEAVDMMRRIKLALDTRGLMNPDKVIRLKIKGHSVDEVALDTEGKL